MASQGLPTEGPVTRSSFQRKSGPAGALHAWRIIQMPTDPEDPLKCEIVQPILVSNVVTGALVTVTGLADLPLTAETKYWLSAIFSEVGAVTGWEVTAEREDPDADAITWSGTGTSEDPFIQTGYYYLLGEVVEGSQPNLAGFDFTIDGHTYHLTQQAFTRLAIIRPCINGRLTWAVAPY
jgi:hypothetical protein